MTVLRFPAHCEALGDYPLFTLALSIWVFVLFLPALMEKYAEEEDSIRSISYTWRHFYGKVSMMAGLLCITVVYFGVCAYDGVLMALIGIGIGLCIPIVFVNPSDYKAYATEGMVHLTFAAILFVYLLVLQIVGLAYTPVPSMAQLIGFVFECVFGALMFVDALIQRRKGKGLAWTNSTSAYERVYVALAGLNLVLLFPDGDLVS